MAYQPIQDPYQPPSYQMHTGQVGATSLPPQQFALPQLPGTHQAIPADDDDDYNWNTSILMTLLCFIFGGWVTLPLNFIAIRLSTSAKAAARRGDAALAQRKAKYALVLNVIVVILYLYVGLTVTSFFQTWWYNPYYH